MFDLDPRAALLAVAVLPALAAAAPLTLDQAVQLAVQRSEAARAARAGVASASQAAHAAGQLPDPMLRAGIDNLPVTGADRLSTTRESMTMKRIGIGQEWVSAEKRAAREAAAQAMVGRDAAAVRIVAADVRLQAATAFVEAYYAAAALELTTLMEHHAHEEFEAARARLSGATGSSQEVLALVAARGVAEDESAELRQRQSGLRVSLERWVGVPADELEAPAGLPGVTEQAFVADHPAVVAAQREVDVARQDAIVAATNRTPNWTWELSYGQRTGYSDMVSFGVNIPLPIAPRERQDRETAARLAQVDKAEATLAEARRAASAEFQVLDSDARRLAERVQRYGSGVVDPARQRTAAALAGYRSNQVSLMTLFEARHAEVEIRRKLLGLQLELARTRVQLAFKPITEGAAR